MEIKSCERSERRAVLKGLLVLLAGIITGGCVGGGGEARARRFKLIEASKIKEGLNEFPLERIAVIKNGEALSAVSLLCTHQTCLLKTLPAGGGFLCPCHGSQFDGQGRVTQGPANDPLPWYQARIVDGWVEIDIPAKI